MEKFIIETDINDVGEIASQLVALNIWFKITKDNNRYIIVIKT